MEVSDDEIDGFADLGDSSVSFTATEEEHDELKTATSDPANWMRHLRKVIGNFSLYNVALPGSHDSATYGIKSNNPNCVISPDFPVGWLASVKVLYPVFVKVSQAQRIDIFQQLEAGIRYFDLRLAPKMVTKPDGRTKEQLWIVHGLFSVPLRDVIKQVSIFMHGHDFEIVILDFQHFYRMNASHHDQVAKMLQKYLGSLLIPDSVNLAEEEIRKLVADQHRVVVMYGYEWDGNGKHDVMPNYPFLRHSPDHLHSPWPNTMSRATLKKYIQEQLSRRSPAHFHVSQLVLTPQPATAVAMKSLRNMAIKVNELVHQWLNEWHLQDLEPNILMIDHVETCPEFVPAVLRLNCERRLKRKQQSKSEL
eukprot:TRINITY_DN8326_c0_g1_i1.p1 TRINITY_DN8326_c0_g1~~TRINITY_DN8326_c0_g1_i1.p1  ORF type:complete len:364 (+),score=51.78 TRINITY_DN8326_c0_g1_i1:122-1213(+)